MSWRFRSPGLEPSPGAPVARRMDEWLDRLSAAVRVELARFRPRELLVMAALPVVITWSLYAVNLATPGRIDRGGHLKGTDFLQVYALGHAARTGDAQTLYDVEAYDRLVRGLVPETPETFFPLYPPQVSVLLSPLAELSYTDALLLWTALSIWLYALAVYTVWRRCPHLRAHAGLVALLALGSPAFFSLVGFGQTSGVALALLAAMLVALTMGRTALAGLAFGLLAFKPHFGLAGAVVMTAGREWRMLAGAAVGAVAHLAIGAGWYGAEGITEYLRFITESDRMFAMLETHLAQTHSLRTQWTLLVPWRPAAVALYLVSAGWVLRRLVRWWGSGAPVRLRHAALIVGTVLVSPHVFVYDLVILTPALLVVADWALAHPRHRFSPLLLALAALTYVSPFLGFLADILPVQVSVVVLTALLGLLTGLPTTGPSTASSAVAAPMTDTRSERVPRPAARCKLDRAG